MNEVISIIIPAYNVENYIVACIESVKAQTYQNIEIIIVNDGSTDDTRILLDELAAKNPTLIVVHQSNQGVSAARNKGLSIATGQYIGFIDADDEVCADMYTFLWCNLKKYDADISHCGFELKKKTSVVQFHNTGTVLLQSANEALKELLSGKLIEPSCCTKLYRRAILDSVRFSEDIKINEDLLFNVMAFKNAGKIIFEDVIKYRYHYNPASASRSTEAIVIAAETYKVAKRIVGLLSTNDIKQDVSRFFVGKLVTNLKLLKEANQYQTTLATLHKEELGPINTSMMGLRLRILKRVLLDFPYFYNAFMTFYTVLFARNQKWS